MAKLGINTGSTPNDGTGDSLLSGAIKVNSNFDEIYSALGDGSTITNSIDFAVIAGYSTASGIATYASNAGIATLANYATSAGIATNASTATYAVNAGFSTGAATADGLAGTPNITVGFVTASYLSGDGGNITGIVTSLIAGNGISLSNNGGTVNVSSNKSDDYPSKWVQTGSGIHTMANVGIGTTTPLADLHINSSQVKLTDSSSINLDDNNAIHFGSSGSGDSSLFWDGTDLILEASTGKFTVKDSTNKIFEAVGGEGPILYYDGVEKLQVQSNTVSFTSDVNVTGDIYTSGVCTAVSFSGHGSNLTGIVTSIVAGTNVTVTNNFGTYTINSSGGAVSTLTGLTDVTLTSPSNGDVLKYDGNGWINDTTAGTYGDSNVDTHLNVSGALTGQILSWNGSDYAWVTDQTGGGSSYANSDVDTHLNVSGATSGQILSWNGSDYAWVADQTGGGGSSTPEITWTLTANGSSHYQFAGDGFPTAQNDPTLYLVRGQTYKFVNNTGAHPFRIQSTTAATGGGTQYNSGVTNQDAGNGVTLTFVVPMDAPDTLYYQCTSHTSMFGTINILSTSSGGGSYANSDVDTHLNVSGASTGEILSWNGSDYAWVADQTGASYANSDVDTHLNVSGATSGQILIWNGSDYDWVSEAGITTSRINANTLNVTGVVTATSFNGNLDASDLASGTIPDARFPATLPTASGANLTNLPSSQLTGALPAIDGSALTNLPSSGTPSYTDVQVVYELTSNSSSSNGWRINGNAFTNTTDNPDIYLVRGQKYRFINNSGGSHPFRIQDSATSAYNAGVTNNGATSGNIDFIPQNGAPTLLYYNCTNHSGMLGKIYIIGEPGRTVKNAETASIAQGAYDDITIPTTGKTFALLKILIGDPAWVILYTDAASRTADAAGTVNGRAEGTDPAPGSGVLAEVSSTSSGSTTFKMTPGLIGWNDDSTPAAQVYARVYNKRATAGSNTVLVALTTVNIEA